MTFTNNILPIDSAYYTLLNATMENNIIEINPGGSVSIEITKSLLSSLSDYVLVSIYPLYFTNSYIPQVFVHLEIVATDETEYDITVAAVYDTSGILSAEIPLVDAEYTYFKYTIYANEAVRILSWELCPELEDADVTTIIDGIEQSLPRVLYDFNPSIITVQQEENVIGMITCDLTGNTDMQGHLIYDFYASEFCIVYLRFRDNEMIELYSPIQFTVNAGHNTLTVPHAYLQRLVGIHDFVITAQVTNGILTSYPRGILFTIDGGYLATRLINTGLDILDIAIEQSDINNINNKYIWSIGLENGQLLVRKRSYGDKASVAWTPMYSLGPGKLGAIEFNGDWIRPLGVQFFTIYTEEIPYLFYVTENNNLYVQIGDVSLNRILLDTNVSCISACRGYKAQNYPAQDQGLVIAYVKDNKAYYRTWSYFEEGEIYLWYAAVQLIDAGTDVTSIQVHRLNDYRLGIVTSSPTKNMWFVTERTYVEQAFAPETFNLLNSALYAKGAVIPASYVYNDSSAMEFSEDYHTLYIVFPYNIFWFLKTMPLTQCLTFSANFPKRSSVTIVDNKIVIVLGNNEVTGEPLIYPKGYQGTITLTAVHLYSLIPGKGYRLCQTTSWLFFYYGIVNADAKIETFNMISNLTANVVMRPIITKTVDAKIETFNMISNLTANVVMLQVGTTPV